MSSYYDVLGVGVDADVDEVRRAYLRQAQRFHPDRYAGSPEAERRRAESQMKALNQAWNTLKNAETRHRYDIEHGLVDADPVDADYLLDDAGWADSRWDDDAPEPRRSLFRRTGVRVAVVSVLVAGLAGSGITVLAGRGDRSPASKRTAGSWAPSAVADLRTAAVNAGLSPTEADCFVDAIINRYRPTDDVDRSVVARAANACR